jgi:hypothetical protein
MTLKTVFLFFLFASTLLAKTARLIWDEAPAEDNVLFYYVLKSEEPRIYRPESPQIIFYKEVFVAYSPFYYLMNLDPNKTYYFIVFAVNTDWHASFPSAEVILSPKNDIKNETTLSDDRKQLVYSITGNSGTYMAIEQSPDLNVWTPIRNVIIGPNNRISTLFPIKEPKMFFRAIQITGDNYQKYSPSLFDVIK